VQITRLGDALLACYLLFLYLTFLTNNTTMKRVTGLGGVFFKATDPKALAAWYDKHLGLSFEGKTYQSFFWDEDPQPEERAQSVFSIFKQDSSYFAPSEQKFMFNLRVENLDWLLETLRSEGVQVMEETQAMDGIGKFGWIIDPEGNKVELWEPPKKQ
jgi:predicted enzyme related to lactoylglutathione lyase